MNYFDIINALFEGFGAYVAWVNFIKLRRDMAVKGVYWPVWGFFSVWGLWNLAFYPAVGAWASATMGAVLCAGNIAWTIQAAMIHFGGDSETAGPALRSEDLVPTRGKRYGAYILKTPKPSYGLETEPHCAVVAKIEREIDEDETTAVWFNDAELVEDRS